jgi:Glycosyltransferase family 87
MPRRGSALIGVHVSPHKTVSYPSQRRASATPFTSLASTLMVVAFLAAVTLVSLRAMNLVNVPGHPDAVHWVLQDFRDAVYYPVVALLDGGNPYDAVTYMHTYPVWFPLPLYSPSTLLVHLPFGLLAFEHAEIAYYVLAILLTLVLVWMSLRFSNVRSPLPYVCGVAGLVLLTRPGQMNLLLGQVTLQCVIATYVALEYARTRPWLAGLGLAVATLKPTFGVPLILLMLCRGDTRAVVTGIGMAGLLALVPTVWLVRAAGGVPALVASALRSQDGFAVQSFNSPMLGPFRIDTPALVARLLGVPLTSFHELLIGGVVLSVGALAVRRLAGEREDARELSDVLICLTMLACVYHQTYDWLLLTLPLTGLIAGRSSFQRFLQSRWRWVLVALLLLPWANYFASATALDAFRLTGGWRLAVTSVNGIALLISLTVCATIAGRSARM